VACGFDLGKCGPREADGAHLGHGSGVAPWMGRLSRRAGSSEPGCRRGSMWSAPPDESQCRVKPRETCPFVGLVVDRFVPNPDRRVGDHGFAELRSGASSASDPAGSRPAVAVVTQPVTQRALATNT
jgi:hypothetical protein